MKKWGMFVFTVFVLGVFLVGNQAYAQQPTERELQLEKMVKQLLERVEELERRESERQAKEQAAPVPAPMVEEKEPDPNTFKTFWKNGLNFETPNKDFTMNIGGRVQNDWYMGDVDHRDFSSGTRFRRIWLKTQGKMFGDFKYKVQADVAGEDSVAWKDIWIDYTGLDIFDIRFGLFKEPFSMEELMLNRDLSFLERAPLNAMVPSRHTGVMFHNTALDDRMTWSAGIFNAGSGSSGEGHDDDTVAGEWDTTLRLTGLPWYENDGEKLLHLGAAYSHREWDKNPLRYRSRGSYRGGGSSIYLVDIEDVLNLDNDNTNNVARPFIDAVDLAGAELGLVYGPFSLMSEYVHSFVDPRAGGSAEYDSLYAQVSYFLTGEHRPYSLADGMWTRVKPANNFDLSEGGWGAWEIGFRYSYMDLTDELTPTPMGGEMNDFTVGLNWYLNPNMRVMWNYVHSETDEVNPMDTDADIIQMRLQFDF